MHGHGPFALAALALVSGAAVATSSIRSTTQVSAADFGYARIAKEVVSTGEGPLLAGDRVLIGSTRRGRAVVREFGLDGSERRVVRVPRARRTIVEMAASDQAMAVITGAVVRALAARAPARRVPAAFGPLAGPLRAFPVAPSDVAVAGALVVSFDSEAPETVRVRDVRAPAVPPREIAVPGATLLIGAAGHYVAVLAGRPSRTRVVVFDLRSGGEIYRVPTRGLQEAAIAADGRVVVLELAAGGMRVVTATPGEPVRREVASMPLVTPRLAVTESAVAVVRRAPRGLGQIVVVGYDGSQRPITPALNGIAELDYDGTRLAFVAGRCVFAGPVPAGPPAAAPRDPCFVEPASLDLRRLGRFGQKGGPWLRVPLTCTVPPGIRCTAHLRLAGPGFTVHQRARIPPGRHVVRVRIPAADRRAAWRDGMTLETLERGHPTAGAAIPQ